MSATGQGSGHGKGKGKGKGGRGLIIGTIALPSGETAGNMVIATSAKKQKLMDDLHDASDITKCTIEGTYEAMRASGEEGLKDYLSMHTDIAVPVFKKIEETFTHYDDPEMASKEIGRAVVTVLGQMSSLVVSED